MSKFNDRLDYYKSQRIFFDFLSDFFYISGNECFLPYVHWEVDGEWINEDCGHYIKFFDAVDAAFNFADKIIRKRYCTQTPEEIEIEAIFNKIDRKVDYSISNIEEIFFDTSSGNDELFQIARKNLLESGYEELTVEGGSNFLSINHKEKSFMGFLNKEPLDWFKNNGKIVDFYLDGE